MVNGECRSPLSRTGTVDPASATPDFRSTTRHLGPTHLTAAALPTRTPSRRARERPVNSGVHKGRLARPARYGAVSTAAERYLAPYGTPLDQRRARQRPGHPESAPAGPRRGADRRRGRELASGHDLTQRDRRWRAGRPSPPPSRHLPHGCRRCETAAAHVLARPRDRRITRLVGTGLG